MSAPERIFLQDGGDYEGYAPFEVTWCVEPQDAADTEYVRADLFHALAAERDRLAADVKQGQLDYCDLMDRHDAHFSAWQSAKAERDRLRDALVEIAGKPDYADDPWSIALAALKGGAA
jgi:hypothetical protein